MFYVHSASQQALSFRYSSERVLKMMIMPDLAKRTPWLLPRQAAY